MARKKKALTPEAPADTTSTESSTPVAAQDVAAPAEHSHAARFQPNRESGQSHAESVGRRERPAAGYTHPYSDRVVGAHRLEHRDPYYSIIRFDEKPADEVRAKLREAGFEWVQRNMEWKRYINFETKEQDREHARRTFDEICKMLRAERGINHEFGGAA